jgi:hypothetical protein
VTKALIPASLVTLIQRRGRWVLPSTFAGKRGSPRSIARRTVRLSNKPRTICISGLVVDSLNGHTKLVNINNEFTPRDSADTKRRRLRPKQLHVKKITWIKSLIFLLSLSKPVPSYESTCPVGLSAAQASPVVVYVRRDLACCLIRPCEKENGHEKLIPPPCEILFCFISIHSVGDDTACPICRTVSFQETLQATPLVPVTN